MKSNRLSFPLGAALAAAAFPVFAIEPPAGASAPPPPPAAAPIPAPAPLPPPVEQARPLPARPGRPAELPQAAYLGVGGYRVPELLAVHLGLKDGEGLVVGSLDPAGPAAAAGLTQNDVLLRIDGATVASREDLTRAVLAKKPGDGVKLDFIHAGKPGDLTVTLGTRPDGPVASSPSGAPLDRMLQRLPQDQARRIRESIEQSLRDTDGAGNSPDMAEPHFDDAIEEMRKRAEKLFEGAADAVPGNETGFSNVSSFRLLDDQGSVELKSRNGGKEVRVLDKTGKEVWSGPWNNEQDKSTAPADVRERVERLNVDMDGQGNSFHLRMSPKPEGR